MVVRYSGINKDLHFDYSNEDLKFEQRVKGAFDGFNANELTDAEKSKLNKLNVLKDSLEYSADRQLSSSLAPGTKININKAYTTDLVALPGVGEVTAERIISYRESNGGFKSIAEIMNVKGIGTKKFEKMKDYITVK